MESPHTTPILAPLEMSPTIGALAGALAKAQSEMSQPKKSSSAVIPMKSGGKYSYTYSDLSCLIEALRVPFSKNGLSYTQLPVREANQIKLTTFILHSSGEWLRSEITMGISENKPQAIGSAITYARRYALGAMAGLSSEEDDDGAAGTRGSSPQTPPKQTQAAPKPAPKTTPKPGFKPKTKQITPLKYDGKAGDQKRLVHEALKDSVIPPDLYGEFNAEFIGIEIKHLAAAIKEFAENGGHY